MKVIASMRYVELENQELNTILKKKMHLLKNKKDYKSAQRYEAKGTNDVAQ